MSFISIQLNLHFSRLVFIFLTIYSRQIDTATETKNLLTNLCESFCVLKRFEDFHDHWLQGALAAKHDGEHGYADLRRAGLRLGEGRARHHVLHSSTGEQDVQTKLHPVSLIYNQQSCQRSMSINHVRTKIGNV